MCKKCIEGKTEFYSRSALRILSDPIISIRNFNSLIVETVNNLKMYPNITFGSPVNYKVYVYVITNGAA